MRGTRKNESGFFFPQSREKETRGRQNTATTQMGEIPQQHLLLVDDEGGFREAMAERLVDHGFRVEQAATGEQALDRLNDFAFDILVTDLRLPGVDGRRILTKPSRGIPRSSRSSSPGLERFARPSRSHASASRDSSQALSVRRTAP